MKKFLSTLFLFVLLANFLACTAQESTVVKPSTKPYVVMISFDGFRWDYPGKAETPNIDAFAAAGVAAESLMPSFPSKTFPNHYTIATGLYPGHHGLINNDFEAPDLGGLKYSIGNRAAVENPGFYGGEPIWNTAEKQGLKAACFYWVGSEAPIQNMRPSYWKKYEHNFPYTARVDTVIAWLQKPESQRPHLITWYVDEPDGKGHKFGPNSPEVAQQIHELDALFGYFITELNKLDIGADVNVILTTDHGMGEVTGERTIEIANYLDPELCLYNTVGNPIALIQPKQGKEDEVYNRLKTAEHITVVRKSEAPEHWYYNQHPRITDIVVVADSSYSIVWRKKKRDDYVGGTHGYDPVNRDMHGIFFAKGPAFKEAYKLATFKNVDIYGLICHILGLEPAANDGDFSRVSGMLKDTE